MQRLSCRCTTQAVQPSENNLQKCLGANRLALHHVQYLRAFACYHYYIMGSEPTVAVGNVAAEAVQLRAAAAALAQRRCCGRSSWTLKLYARRSRAMQWQSPWPLETSQRKPCTCEPRPARCRSAAVAASSRFSLRPQITTRSPPNASSCNHVRSLVGIEGSPVRQICTMSTSCGNRTSRCEMSCGWHHVLASSSS